MEFTSDIAVDIAVFTAATIVVWLAGTRLVLYGDEIAERFGLGRAFVGLIVLAAITELPEAVTTLTAAGKGAAPLALGNMFGGVMMQTAILAVADLLFVRRPLTSWPRKPIHALEAVILIFFLCGLLGLSLVGEQEIFAGIGVGSLALFLAYPVAIWILRRYDERVTWAPIDMPEASPRAAVVTERGQLAIMPTHALLTRIVVGAILILVAGYVTADRADAIAVQTGLGGTFVGVALLAAATSTPEVSTTFAAVRIGAYTMAISNIIGSNLLMIALIFPADLAYRSGPILAEVSLAAQVSLVAGILVSAIYAAGLLIRRTPSVLGAGADSILVIVTYLGSLAIIYHLA